MTLKAAWRALWTPNPPSLKGVITDEARAISIEARVSKAAQIRRAEEIAQLHHLKKMEEIHEELRQMREARQAQPFDAEGMILQIIQSKMGATPPSSPAPPSPSPTTNIQAGGVQLVSLTDEQIRKTIASFPSAQVQMFACLPEDMQRAKIEQYFPEVDDDTIDRALMVLRG